MWRGRPRPRVSRIAIPGDCDRLMVSAKIKAAMPSVEPTVAANIAYAVARLSTV